MVLGLSFAFVLPRSWTADPVKCERCTLVAEELGELGELGEGCCHSEEENPRPCESEDCECPDCPFCAPKVSSLAALIFSTSEAVAPSGVNLRVPDRGLGDERVLESPPSPPPRVG